MGDAFVALAILLSGEIEVDTDGRGEGGVINGSAIEGCRARDIEGSVTEAEGMAIGATIGMLAWAEQVEVADEEKVPDGGLERVGRILGVDGVPGEGQRDGLHPHRRRVGRLPRPLELLDGLDNIASDI
jgi:hypothetical protein